MVAMLQHKEFHLARPGKARPTLEDMRRKLAAGAPQSVPTQKDRRKSRRPGRKQLIWTAVLAAMLIGANFLVRAHREEILQVMGLQAFAAPLAAPAGLSLDDRARFWAYAAFDEDRLRKRFKIPAAAEVDAEDARHHLEGLLTQPLGMSARAEILTLQRSGKESGR